MEVRKIIEPLLLTAVAALAAGLGHALLLDLSADPRVVLQPWLLGQGFIPYRHIVEEHAPLFPQLLAWLAPLFGGDPLLTARVFQGTAVAAAVALPTWWTAGRAGRAAGLAAAVFFVAWSSRFGYWVIWHEVLLAPITFLIFMLMAGGEGADGRRRAALLGLLTAAAVLIKQQALLLIPLALLWLWRRRRDGRPVRAPALFYLLGLAAPVAAYLLFYAGQGGSIQDLLYWTLTFNLTGDYRTLGLQLPASGAIYRIAPAFLLTVPFLFSLIEPHPAMRPSRAVRGWLVLFALAAAVYLYPRYSPVHWAVVLPFLAAITGIAAADLVRWPELSPAKWGRQRAIYLAFLLLWLVQGAAIYWPRLTGAERQTLLKYDELIPLAETLRDRLPPDGRLLLLPNDEGTANLHYLLRRPPPHFWLMQYPWFIDDYTVGRWLTAVRVEQPETVLRFVGRGDPAARRPEMLQAIDRSYTAVETIPWGEAAVEIWRRNP